MFHKNPGREIDKNEENCESEDAVCAAPAADDRLLPW